MSRLFTPRILALAALLAALPAPALAQEVPARLTLDDALRLARANNPVYRQALNDVDVAAAQAREGLGALLPNLNASVGFNGQNARSYTGRGNYEEVLTSDSVVVTRGSNASQSVSMAMTLFDGGANVNRMRGGRAQVRAAEARIDARAMQLRADVATRFFMAMMRERNVAVEEALLISAREQFEITQRRFEIGSARREEILGAEVELATQELQAERARNEARKARLELLREMGIDFEAEFTVVGEPPAPFDPSGLEVEALTARALGSNPRILEAAENVRARELGARAARGARLPTVSANASFSRSQGFPEYDGLFVLDPLNRSMSFGLSVTLPIFTRFQTSSAIVAADAQLDDAHEQLRAERLAVETEVRTALLDLRNAYRSVELAERSLALSQERLELTLERYRIGGTVSFVELQNATDGAARAERQMIEARFNFVQALIALESRVGGEVRP